MRKPWSQLASAIEQFKDNLTEAQWDGLRAAAGIAILALLGAAGYYGGYPLWRRWQNRQALAQAGNFRSQRDYRDMLLSLRRATELEPMDVATWRQVESSLAEIGSPDTLVADQQLALLSPRDMGLRLAWVEDALRFGRVGTAETELGRLDAAARRDAAFHRLSAALALALGRSAEFESEVAALVAADPRDVNARFTYAALRLWSADPARAAAGRADLEGLLAEPSARIRATVELLAEGARRGDPTAFQSLLKRMLALYAPGTRPDFSTPDPPAWNALLEGIEAAAAARPADAALVARWLADIGRADASLAWLNRLPPASRNAPIVLDVAAELDAGAGRLSALDVLLRRGAWGGLPGDAVTLALAARVQRKSFDAKRARATWDDAVAACGDSVAGLRALARMASIWQETDSADEALEAVVARAPESLWAYRALRNDYAARRDVQALWRLYSRWTQVFPDDGSVAAQWVLLGSVLGQPMQDAYAKALAAHRSDPSSRLATLAEAAALWRDRRPAEAWSVLERFPEAVRRLPSVAFWTAIVRADLGDAVGTAAAISSIRRSDLSDEEAALLRRAAVKAGVSMRTQ